MAKVINLSDDAGVTWYPLPGSEGSFQSEAEQIDDTILGQTFQSNEVGLVGWGISSNGIFKGFAGYLAEIKQGGTPTATADEACSLVTGKTYQVDDVTKRVMDRQTATLVVDDNAAPVAAADIESIDYLFGRVTFVASYTPTTPITMDYDYLPLAAVGKANTYNMSMTAEAIDETDFATAQANSGTRIFTSGLRTVALELGGIYDSTEDLRAALIARSELIIDIDPAGDGSAIARGFFKLATAAQAGTVGALEEETLNFTLSVPIEETNPAVEFPFNWQFTSTTLATAIQVAITSWVSELNTYELQYLPEGAIGQTPNDGVEGTFVATDISLSGGLSNMNVFTMELQGTDEYAVV